MKRRYTCVLIDADNTLLDFDATEAQALRRTMERRGLPYNEETRARYMAINRALWDAFHRGEVEQEWLKGERFRRFGAELGWSGDAGAWDAEYLDAMGDCGALLPGAVELLQALKPYCRIGLATNGLKTVQRRRLTGNPITAYLDGVFISQEMGVGKPHKAYFEQVLTALNASPEETVMVGDDLLSDIQGAINAGLDSIWYSRNGGFSPLPTYTVADLGDVAKIVLGRENEIDEEKR